MSDTLIKHQYQTKTHHTVVFYHLHSCSLRCCSCISCGVFLWLLPEVFREELHEFGVLDRVLALEAGGVQRGATGNHGRAARLHYDCRLKLSDELAGALREHGVGHQHVVVDALAHAHLGCSLVADRAQGEGQRWEPLVHFDEESSRTFHL